MRRARRGESRSDRRAILRRSRRDFRSKTLKVAVELGSRPARRAAPEGPEGLDAGDAEPASSPIMLAVGGFAADMIAHPLRFAPSGWPRYPRTASSATPTAPRTLASVPDRDLPTVGHLRGIGEAEGMAIRDPCRTPRRSCRVEQIRGTGVADRGDLRRDHQLLVA